MDSAVDRETCESRRMQAIVQAIDSARDVRRKSQFFVWTQGSLQTLLPHKLAICGAYDRARKEVRLQVFNSVVVPTAALEAMTQGGSAAMAQIVDAWIGNRCRAVVVKLAATTARLPAAAFDVLRSAGLSELLVHGVSRPQRPTEIETLFVLGSPGCSISAGEVDAIEMMLPQLHSTYLRMLAVERDIGASASRPTTPGAGYSTTSISGREEQVLVWVREGMSNQEIGAQLGISPLTVKNHVQKILRKLGATNRAQAVALAMRLNLLAGASAIGRLPTT
jgi:transcriptional regulator EpsA